MFSQLYAILQSENSFPFFSLIFFFAGGIITFLVTSVNHKRIHRDDIRKTLFDAVLDTKKYASEYWHSEYSERNRSDLIGSITFFQHIMTLSEGMMNKKQRLQMKAELRKFVLALRGKNDMAQECHEIDPERVAEIHTTGSFFLKQYYSIYLKQTTIITLTVYPRWIQIGNLYPSWIRICNLCVFLMGCLCVSWKWIKNELTWSGVKKRFSINRVPPYSDDQTKNADD